MSKIVLGKGLGALIPTETPSGVGERRYRSVPLERIAPNPMQPRQQFDTESLKELAESFKRHGVMQPLVVRQDGSMFTIIAGERRFRAARLAGLAEVPVVLLDAGDDHHLLELALVENLQRQDLNPLEAAQAYYTLIDRCHLTQAQLAERIGKSRAAVANAMRLLSLPEAIKQMIREGKLTEGHARAILVLDDEAAQLQMAARIVDDALSVRQAEQVTRRPRGRRLIPKRKLPVIAEAENELRQSLGTAVRIHHSLKGGRIEIEYYSDNDLTRLLELFQKLRN